MKHLLLATAIALLLTGIFSNACLAQSADISKAEAIAIAQGVQPGKVLAITLVNTKKGSAYRVKTLNNSGDVHILLIDAQNGKLLSSQ